MCLNALSGGIIHFYFLGSVREDNKCTAVNRVRINKQVVMHIDCRYRSGWFFDDIDKQVVGMRVTHGVCYREINQVSASRESKICRFCLRKHPFPLGPLIGDDITDTLRCIKPNACLCLSVVQVDCYIISGFCHQFLSYIQHRSTHIINPYRSFGSLFHVISHLCNC